MSQNMSPIGRHGKTGKLPSIIDASTPTYSWLMDGAKLPTAGVTAPPTSRNVSNAVSRWPMLLNDKLSNCTIAAAQHAVQFWTAMNGCEIMPDDSCALAGYVHATGYNPVTGEGDNGAVMLNILKYWMHTGLPINADGANDMLDGLVSLNPLDINSLISATRIFGCVYAGLELPITAFDEFDLGNAWADISGPPAEGHCVLVIDTDDEGPLCVTWGRIQPMTWSWWLKYASEACPLLRRKWIGGAGVSPSGLTMAQLDDKIASLRGNLGLGAR